MLLVYCLSKFCPGKRMSFSGTRRPRPNPAFHDGGAGSLVAFFASQQVCNQPLRDGRHGFQFFRPDPLGRAEITARRTGSIWRNAPSPLGRICTAITRRSASRGGGSAVRPLDPGVRGKLGDGAPFSSDRADSVPHGTCHSPCRARAGRSRCFPAASMTGVEEREGAGRLLSYTTIMIP